jgi:hypothetical protein
MRKIPNNTRLLKQTIAIMIKMIMIIIIGVKLDKVQSYDHVPKRVEVSPESKVTI